MMQPSGAASRPWGCGRRGYAATGACGHDRRGDVRTDGHDDGIHDDHRTWSLVGCSSIGPSILTVDRTQEQALARSVESAEGEPVRCEPSLAPIAKRFGIPSAPAPPEAYELCALTVTAFSGLGAREARGGPSRERHCTERGAHAVTDRGTPDGRYLYVLSRRSGFQCREACASSARRVTGSLSSSVQGRYSERTAMTATWSRKLLAPLVLLSVTAFTAPAMAEDVRIARAQVVYTEGVRAANKHRHADALQKFEEAYAIYPGPNILAAIGREEQVLGHDLEAVRDLRAALLNPENAGRLKAQIAEAESKLGRLQISGPEGTHIIVDEHDGTLPLREALDVARGPFP